MAIKTLDYTITGVSSGNLVQLSVNEAFNTPARSAVVNVSGTTLGLGDSITINIGFTGNTAKVFSGYVTNIQKSTPAYEIAITCEDVLTKALNFFIAADDPENPITYSNIESGAYVQNILALAELTTFESTVTPPTFTWGTDLPAEVNLVSAWQAANEMANMLAYHIHADRNGKVWFTKRAPYIMGGDSDDFQFDETAGTNVLSLSYTKSIEETRNKVVVYGRKGIFATASQSRADILYSANYYKTAVIAHPLIQTTSLAQTTADYNLTRFNRLTEVLQLEVEGNPNLEINKIAEITGSTFSGIGTSDWFIYQCRHNFSPSGYTVDITLTK